MLMGMWVTMATMCMRMRWLKYRKLIMDQRRIQMTEGRVLETEGTVVESVKTGQYISDVYNSVMAKQLQ